MVVGPEAPLVAGLADRLLGRRVRVFGPERDAARIEGSKSFAKEVMARRGVPTARAGAFDDAGNAVAFLDELGGVGVVKADGLAAGKGVTVASDRASAVAAIEECLAGAFGEAGRVRARRGAARGARGSAVRAGRRATATCVLLVLQPDHKRIGDGDTGPNTGGMGAYSPVPTLDARPPRLVLDTVIAPVVDGLRPTVGVLFAGLMLTADGPKVLEFNCRFGDPETQVVVPRCRMT